MSSNIENITALNLVNTIRIGYTGLVSELYGKKPVFRINLCYLFLSSETSEGDAWLEHALTDNSSAPKIEGK